MLKIFLKDAQWRNHVDLFSGHSFQEGVEQVVWFVSPNFTYTSFMQREKYPLVLYSAIVDKMELMSSTFALNHWK